MAAEALEKRFAAYVDALASALAHADRTPTARSRSPPTAAG